VGFSYSKNTADYTVGDERTADDTYLFMQGFYQKFPQLASNDFWMTGESYGGHYVPNAAARIIRGNEQKEGAHINLKGFMVGNAWTDATIDNRGAVDFWFQHGIVSAPTYAGIVASCNFSDVGPLKARGELSARRGNDACDSFCDKANQEMGAINIYDVYEDICESDPSRSISRASSDANAAQRLVRLMGQMSPLFAPRSAQPSPPCIDDYTTSWINQEAVYQVLFCTLLQ
jgi:serine carboxypeptidase-like clade II